jgi:hypothetical protein
MLITAPRVGYSGIVALMINRRDKRQAAARTSPACNFGRG